MDDFKDNEITVEKIKSWDERGYFPVACRLCGSVTLYPKMTYKPKDFIGWECSNCIEEYKLYRNL